MPMLENSRIRLSVCHGCGRTMAAAYEIGTIPGTTAKGKIPVQHCQHCDITLYGDESETSLENQRSAAKSSA
jgi:hypothetical protein